MYDYSHHTTEALRNIIRQAVREFKLDGTYLPDRNMTHNDLSNRIFDIAQQFDLAINTGGFLARR